MYIDVTIIIVTYIPAAVDDMSFLIASSTRFHNNNPMN